MRRMSVPGVQQQSAMECFNEPRVYLKYEHYAKRPIVWGAIWLCNRHIWSLAAVTYRMLVKVMQLC